MNQVDNIVQILEQRAKLHPERPAICSKTETISYADFYANVRTTAHFIQEKGLKPGDRILVYIPMSIRLYEILLAIFSNGMTAVFADAWTTKNRLSDITNFLEPKAFWGIPKAHIFRILHKSIRKIPHHWFPSFGNSSTTFSDEIIHPNANEPALITLTSGSTGFPKAANRTHAFLLAQHAVLSETLQLEEASFDMPTLPIFVLNNLATGVTTVLPDMDFIKAENVDPAKIIAQWKTYKVDSVTGSPVFFDKMADFVIESKLSDYLQQKIFLGGAPVYPYLAKKLRLAFPKTEIQIVYGSTESEPISEVSIDEFLEYVNQHQTKGLFTGKPVKQIETLILPITSGEIEYETDEELRNSVLQKGEIGEIVVKGPHVLPSYVNQPKEEKLNKIKTATSVWHRTGDAGFFDEEGRLFLTGRATSAIEWKGKLLFSFPVEMILSELSEIKHAALLKKNNELNLVISFKDTSTKKLSESIRKKVEELVLNYLSEIPKIRLLQSFPLDPRHNSKIDYVALSKMIK